MNGFKYVVYAVIVLEIALGVLYRDPPHHTLKASGIAQGTTFSVVGDFPIWVSQESFSAQVISVFDDMDRQVSVYEEGSEISRFNRMPAGQKMRVSEDFVRLFLFGRRLHSVSNGQWDATVGGEVTNYLNVRLSHQQIWKTRSGIRLCFDSIAQGYTLDRITQQLVQHGASRVVVEIGGEVRVYSERSINQSVRIAVPDTDYTQFSGQVMINNEAISTSGYDNGSVKIIDPKRGKLRNNRFSSVVVVARSGIEADGLSTTLWVTDTDQWGHILSHFPGARVVSP